MINFPEIAKNAIEVIVPFLAIGGKEVIKNTSSDLYKTIKGIFKKNDDIELLEKFEKKPDDINTKATVEYVLEKELKQDKQLAEKIRQLTNEIQKTTVYKNYSQNYANVNGNNNTTIQGATGNISIGKNT